MLHSHICHLSLLRPYTNHGRHNLTLEVVPGLNKVLLCIYPKTE
jgi:hypothetical protein